MRVSGTHLGPYEILQPIGAGGMGQVYKARDTRLNRSKILPADDERRGSEKLLRLVAPEAQPADEFSVARVAVAPILGGLHHEYRLEKAAG
jgi:serine/threonine protein kinase